MIDDLRGLEALAAEWDELAVASSNPPGAPAWLLAWCRHVAAEGVEPRLVALRDGGRLIGLAPFYVARRWRGVVEYRLMGGSFGMRVEPPALPGHEWDVAAQIARVLNTCLPRPDVLAFGPMAAASSWPRAFASGWSEVMHAPVHRYRQMAEPVVVLDAEGFGTWYASLGSKTRRNLRREQRLFEAAGGETRWSTASTLRADAEVFARLHMARWARRGQSRLSSLGTHLPDWLEQVGADLIEQGRFRMCMLEIEGRPICANLHLTAGEECAGVNSAWDEGYSRLAPGKLAMVRMIEDAGRQGCRRVSLGGGTNPYKLLFANGDDPIAWTWVMRPGPRLPKVYGRALPYLLGERAKSVARAALPPDTYSALGTAYRRRRPRAA